MIESVLTDGLLCERIGMKSNGMMRSVLVRSICFFFLSSRCNWNNMNNEENCWNVVVKFVMYG